MGRSYAEIAAQYRDAPSEAERLRVQAEIEHALAAHLLAIIERRGASATDLRVQMRIPRIAGMILAGRVAPEKVGSYLESCVTFGLRDAERRRRSRGVEVPIEDQPALSATAADPVRSVDAKRLLARVMEIIESGDMPENYRLALVEVVLGERDRDDLARERGVDGGTVDQWVSRGRRWLQGRLASLEERGGR